MKTFFFIFSFSFVFIAGWLTCVFQVFDSEYEYSSGEENRNENREINIWPAKLSIKYNETSYYNMISKKTTSLTIYKCGIANYIF